MSELESELEQYCRKVAIEQGFILLKLQGNKGWPDRVLLSPWGDAVFIEFKRRGEQPRPLQLHILNILREKGFSSTWIHTREQFLNTLTLLRSFPRSGNHTSTKPEE